MSAYVCTVYICLSAQKMHQGLKWAIINVVKGSFRWRVPHLWFLLSLSTLKLEVDSALGWVGLLALAQTVLQKELQIIAR